MKTVKTPVGYRELMRQVEQIVAEIERSGEETVIIHLAADEIISRLREELGIWGGRLYEREGNDYVLRATFPMPARSMSTSAFPGPIRRSSCA